MVGPLLQIRDLTVAATRAGRAKPILNEVTLDIEAGETLCLVGESGSGKTVTALTVMGLLPREVAVRSGSIRFDGQDLANAPEGDLRAMRAARMSMIFQEPMSALHPMLTIGHQIEEVLIAHTAFDGAERRRRVAGILEQVELADTQRFASVYPHQLSGGERQRAMIAMALVLQPKLLIADEPTSALDVRTQKQILALIRSLAARFNTATLFITHDMGVVTEIAERVAVMQHGQIVECGPIKDVLTEPQHPYTGTLLSAVPSLTPREPCGEERPKIALATRSLTAAYQNMGWFRPRRRVEAIRDIDLQVHQGRTLGLVGESGSGKSTLARCLVRLLEPSDGRIVLAGTDITALTRKALLPHRRDIQIVFQDPYRSLNPRLPIAEIIIEGPTNFGVSRESALREAANLLELVGLPKDALDAFPHQLSGGQRQRVALARALALKPRVLVADEAVSALDMPTQADILRLLAELQRHLGIAILFITHDLRAAAQICDEVAIMQGGRIVECGPAAEILARPRHTYTRALIEAAPGRHWDFGQRPPVAG